MELLKGFLGGELDMQILCLETVKFSLENKKKKTERFFFIQCNQATFSLHYSIIYLRIHV